MTQKFKPDQPYNELPLLPPSQDVESKLVLKRAISARAAVEGLKHAGRKLPKQSVLLHSIVLQEAKSSSEIEGIVTTDEQLYRAFSKEDETTDAQTESLLRYGMAVWQGYDLIKRNKPLNSSACCLLASALAGKKIGVRTGMGTRIGNVRTREIYYTPPQGERLVRGMLDNLVAFQRSNNDLDPLVKLAIGHYQFEAIHPFSEGNGRAGRLLCVLWMVEQGLLEWPILYLSQAILGFKVEYYAGLLAVTEFGQWESWISYFLEAIEVAALETTRRIELICRILADGKAKARSQIPKIYSDELIDLVFSQPYTRIGLLEPAGIAKRQTASVYLQELERIGLLRSHRIWREVLYVNDDLMKALA